MRLLFTKSEKIDDLAYNENELPLIKGDLVIYLDAEITPSRPHLHDLLQMYETDGYYLSA